jgi:DNA-3-methyladenine glycosylase II
MVEACLKTQEDLIAAAAELRRIEARFGVIADQHGLPHLRPSDQDLRGLLMIVVEQLISLSAAKSIWFRIEAALGDFSPEVILRFSEADLQSLGLTRAKARSFLVLAEATQSGGLDLAGLQTKTNDEVISHLISHSGIGPWTANVYLLTALGRADSWPAGDVALQSAVAQVFQLPTRPNAKEMHALSQPWRPHRMAAALLLWSHYRHAEGISPQVN